MARRAVQRPGDSRPPVPWLGRRVVAAFGTRAVVESRDLRRDALCGRARHRGHSVPDSISPPCSADRHRDEHRILRSLHPGGPLHVLPAAAAPGGVEWRGGRWRGVSAVGARRLVRPARTRREAGGDGAAAARAARPHRRHAGSPSVGLRCDGPGHRSQHSQSACTDDVLHAGRGGAVRTVPLLRSRDRHNQRSHPGAGPRVGGACPRLRHRRNPAASGIRAYAALSSRRERPGGVRRGNDLWHSLGARP